MNLIEFFGNKVKPRITKGKGLWKPLETGYLGNNIYAIRDKDVNCFLIKTLEGYISIDSGYKNSVNIRSGLEKLNIKADEVRAVFLTHLDIDHAGGMDINSEIVFPRSKIYLGTEENKYLTGEYCRKKIAFIRCKLPITLGEDIYLLQNDEELEIGKVNVKALFTPGHTLGHISYLVNDSILFTGDSIIGNEDGGYSFYDFWNSDSEQNKQSLLDLKKRCNKLNIDKVITSHSGIFTKEKAFAHIEKSVDWKNQKQPFIKDAPENPYE